MGVYLGPGKIYQVKLLKEEARSCKEVLMKDVTVLSFMSHEYAQASEMLKAKGL